MAHNPSASAMMAVNTIAHKEQQYREQIKENHNMSCFIGEAMARGGELEKTMMDAAGDDEEFKQEIQDFLEEQKGRLKQVSQKNIEGNRNIDVFLAALNGDVRSAVLQGDPNADYEKVLDQSMKKLINQRKETDLEFEEEELYREICSKLNEKQPKKKKAKKSGGRKSKGGDDSDDDDDLEVVNLPTTSEQSLKCPITGKLYDDPVKHKVCKHTYSRQGLLQVIRSSNARCPVPGCRTTGITMQQVEEDKQMEMKVRQFKRRQDREKQQRLTQDVESDDEDVL